MTPSSWCCHLSCEGLGLGTASAALACGDSAAAATGASSCSDVDPMTMHRSRGNRSRITAIGAVVVAAVEVAP